MPKPLLQITAPLRAGGLQLLKRDGVGGQLGSDRAAEERIVEVDADLATRASLSLAA